MQLHEQVPLPFPAFYSDLKSSRSFGGIAASAVELGKHQAGAFEASLFNEMKN